jgi:hypothetical protein
MVAGGRINRTFRVLRRYIKQGVEIVDKAVSTGVEVLDRAMSSFLPVGAASYRRPSSARKRRTTRRANSRKH